MPNASLTSIGKTASIVLLFCFRQFSLDQSEQEKEIQKEQGTLTPSRGSSYLKILTIVQKKRDKWREKERLSRLHILAPGTNLKTQVPFT